MNDHLTDYLNYYVKLKKAPEFAILIRGEWGSGKTWFIRKYLSRRGSIKYLYISLNGLTDPKQIEDAFFQQLHPILASKGMKLAGKILKGVLKTTIRVDLNDEGDVKANVTSSVPDIKVPEYLKKIDDNVLIFDDLERCLLPIPTTLGYINEFVENYGSKVIILCNERQLIADQQGVNQEHSSNYLTIKEKIIGKSFTVLSDLDSAYWSFTAQLSRERVKKLFSQKEEKVKNWYKKAAYRNLRHLRLSILDFERFYSHLESVAKRKEDLIEHLLGIFLAISFEIRKGAPLTEDTIPILLQSSTSTASSLETGSEAKDGAIRALRFKYDDLNWTENPLEERHWTSYFKEGRMDRTAVQESLNNSIYFIDENTPDWIKLHQYTNLGDSEFDRLYESIREKFSRSNPGYEDKYELIQVAGMLLLFNNLGIKKVIPAKILKTGKKNLNQIKENGGFQSGEYLDRSSSHSRTYYSQEDPVFQELLIHAQNLISKTLPLQPKEISSKLLEELKQSVSQFESAWGGLSDSPTPLEQPIISYINPTKFVTVVAQISNSQKTILAQFLRSNYALSSFEPVFAPRQQYELDWLLAVSKELQKLLKKRKGKLSAHFLNTEISQAVENAISVLDKLKEDSIKKQK